MSTEEKRPMTLQEFDQLLDCKMDLLQSESESLNQLLDNRAKMKKKHGRYDLSRDPEAKFAIKNFYANVVNTYSSIEEMFIRIMLKNELDKFKKFTFKEAERIVKDEQTLKALRGSLAYQVVKSFKESTLYADALKYKNLK